MIRHLRDWSTVRWGALLCFGVIPWMVVDGAVAQVGNQPANVDAPPKKSGEDFESRLKAALDRAGDWRFLDQSLGDVMKAIAEKAGIEILIDRRALEEYGLSDDQPVTLVLQGMRLESCLNHLLRPLDLTWIVRDEAILITTVEEAEMAESVQVYPVKAIIELPPGAGEGAYDYDSLIEAITSTITMDAWQEVGGPASIAPFQGTLVVSHSVAGHRTISHLINHLHGLIKVYREDPKKVVPPIVVEPASNGKVRQALDQPITAEWVDVSLSEVVGALYGQAKVPIFIDVRALEEYGIATDEPITLKVENLALRHVLRRLLRPLELSYVVRDEALVITTEEEAEMELLTVIYPVAHLAGAGEGDEMVLAERLDHLIRAVTSSIAVDSWTDVGGPGAVACLLNPPCLIVSQTEEMHEQISMLLSRLYHAVEGQPDLPSITVGADALRIERYYLSLDQGAGKTIATDDVINLIMRTVAWGGANDAYIGALGESIVVRHNDKVHHEVRRLLQRLGLLSSPPYSGFSGFGSGASPLDPPTSLGGGMDEAPSGGFFHAPADGP